MLLAFGCGGVLAVVDRGIASIQFEQSENRGHAFRALLRVRSLGFGGVVPFALMVLTCATVAPWMLAHGTTSGIVRWRLWSAIVFVALVVRLRRLT